MPFPFASTIVHPDWVAKKALPFFTEPDGCSENSSPSPYMPGPVFSQTAIDEQSGFFDTRFLS